MMTVTQTFNMFGVTRKRTYPSGQPVAPQCALTVAALAFLRQQIVSLENAPVPRGDRRRAQKEGKPEPVVRVVMLRKRVRKEAETSEGTMPVDWSCQWLVGAHWRKNHWDTDRPIFVNSYLKGPEDKPFRASPKALYHVKR